MWAAVAAAAAALASARPSLAAPGATEARGYVYSDNGGVRVTTAVASAVQRLPRAIVVSVRAVADFIQIRKRVLDPGDPGAAMQLTGHHHPDAVTSASSTAGGGGVAEKWRFEGAASVATDRVVRGAPAGMSLFVRGSSEPDYTSVSGQLAGSVELFERNLVLSAFIGGGHDWVQPVEAPPGQAGMWPATHQRVTGGVTASQLLTPRLALRGGVGVSAQWGMLSNPYRRAIVLPAGATVGTLFPEVLPRWRDRFTGFVGLSWAVGAGFALHVQQGAYIDTWEVAALIPEVMLARAIGDRGIAYLRYRYYAQTQAWFHSSHYHTLDTPFLSGDPRLGPVRDHTAGAEVRLRIAGNPVTGVAFLVGAGYDVSVLHYESTSALIGHVGMLSLTAAYGGE